MSRRSRRDRTGSGVRVCVVGRRAVPRARDARRADERCRADERDRAPAQALHPQPGRCRAQRDRRRTRRMNDEPITSTNGATAPTEGSTPNGVSTPAVVVAPNGVTMTKTEHKSTRPRGAKGAPYRPHARRNYRNAAPRSSTPRSPGGAPEETTVDRLGYVGYSAVGAAIASVGGVFATRLGFHPRTVAIVLGA